MRKVCLLLLLLLLPLYLFGADKADKVEVYATNIDNQASIVKASGDVIVLYKDYYISAQDAVYDRQNGNLELFGNVRATQGSNYQLLGDYAKLNIKNKERIFKPFYMLEQKSELWLSADKGHIKDTFFDVRSGMVSGCNPNNPLWKIKFSSSNYDATDKWMNLYNARLYIYDIPIFYMPYFGYSLDTTRRSGLLIPAFGISSDEGFYYEQPIYIAVQNWWDLEIKPQIRTSRGYGSYETFRFADSKISRGSITTGYFKEQRSYVNLNNLAHETHYGVNFKYNNGDFLDRWFGFGLKGQSGIYADISWMNDVDYINLSTADTINNVTSNQILSQVNMFYNTDRNYFGAYFKYYLNLSLQSNARTIQKLPTIQYHNYLSTLLDDHLTYDIDFSSTNFYREVGKNALRSSVNIPVELQTSIADEYINLSYASQLYAEHTTFSGPVDRDSGQDPNVYEDGIFLRQYNVFNINTNLTRAYDNVTHTVVFGAEYVKPGSDAKYGYYKTRADECTNDPTSVDCEFYSISDVVEKVGLDLSQYLFDENGDQFLYHRVSQQISYATGKGKLGEIENELDYKVTKTVNYYNDTFYNYDQHLISKTINTIGYTNEGVKISLSYLYKDSFIDPLTVGAAPRYTKYLTSSFSYKYNDHYSYFGSYNYDVQAAVKKSSEIGFLYSKRCWDFGLRYVENVRPILTAANTASSIDDRYIFFTITLKPIGGSELNYRIPSSAKGQ
ncbi:LPS assembly protein LptD [Sulfurimonas sp. HSL-1716]|uniref:LPS-assembly protein LptD n=1 Tax=Hydrocurvibacter sulfurireducens TaxID=3131937 RepID=UPI0031F7531C